MIDSQTINPIRINHVGYLPGADKILVIESPPETVFTVHLLRDTVFTEVYRGTLVREEGELEAGWLGNFSAVTAPGNYQIRCGSVTSRRFVVWDKAYDPAVRLMLGYFTWQRCGSPLGWAGTCHQDDGTLADTGERIDVTGGYHQSCDLRKSPGGVSIGLLGLLKSALLYVPEWDTGCIADEVRWACDHYLKCIQPDGSLYNTLGAPFGWAGRTYYKAPAPASAHWNTLRVLALGALYLRVRNGDDERSTRYLAAARSVWDYMTSAIRPEGPYHHPDALPRGMDPEYFYRHIYKGATADLCYRLSAAADLYRATGESGWLVETERCGREILECFAAEDDVMDNLASACLRREKGSTYLIEGIDSYSWQGGGILALCDALELLPDSPLVPRWRERLVASAQQYTLTAGRNIWRRIPRFFSESDLGLPTGHPAPGRPPRTVRDTLDTLYPAGRISSADRDEPCWYSYGGRSLYPSYALLRMLVLRRAARLLNELEYTAIAQRNLDYLLGANPMDASHVEAVGYNQTPVPVFGQFFPSTPQIPGAVNVGFRQNDHGPDNGSEYDMPCVGMAMWLLADMLFTKDEG